MSTRFRSIVRHPSLNPSTQSAQRGAAQLLAVAALIALGILLAAGWYFGRQAKPEEVPELTLEERYLQDERIQDLLRDCSVGKEFKADPDALMGVMVDKLSTGHLDVLHRYKQLLAQRGPEAVPTMRRLFDKAYSDEWGSPVLQNVLASCAMMKSDAGMGIARDGFQHPNEVVRLASLDVIRVHGTPEDYDSIVGWMPMVAKLPSALDYLKGLAKSDYKRFAEDAVSWVEGGMYPGMWFLMVPLLDQVYDEDLAQRMLALAIDPNTKQELRAALLVPAARLGDPVAEGELTKRLTSEIHQRVTLGLAAIEGANLHSLAAGVLLSDERSPLRERAAQVIAGGPHTDESLALLNEGLSDSVQIVRQACLGGLLDRKDDAAVSRVLLDLTRGPQERDAAFAVMQGRWDVTPDFADRGLEALIAEYETMQNQEGRISIMKVLGRIPRRKAAEFLLDNYQDMPNPVGGLRPFRWAVGHAFNTGQSGMDLLYERLASETDPIHRLDLIHMIWQDKSEASKEVLLEILVDKSRSEYERLYAADRLVLFADPEQLVPLITRELYHPSENFHVRPAAQCLLWRWFGLPKAQRN